jgi:hypothetical protein
MPIIEKKRERIQGLEEEILQLRGEVEAMEKTLLIAEVEGLVLTTPTLPTMSRAARVKKKGKRERKRPVPRSLANILRKMLPNLEAPFSTGLVRQKLQEMEPELYEETKSSSIAATLRRLADTGELEVAERGGPGKEAAYKLPGGHGVRPPSLLSTGTEG